ncbi:MULTISPECIES: hypothetical protein [unclassified Streptomyces]|jgi:hypothetical protein|uniref:Uncharacterized protein n=2 Tax=Streptomyces TaxID=1883 RepID=A0ABV5VIQ9_9ACTN
MRLTFDGDWHATVTNEPLTVTPRLVDGASLKLTACANREETDRFVAGTFGSHEWLWDAVDSLRFDRDTRRLAGAEFRIPEEAADPEDCARLPHTPDVHPAVRPGGLLADEIRDFRHEPCTVICRAPDDSVLTCLRDLQVLDSPLEARIGIAPDVALLVQHGSVVGWSLTDPVRHLTTGYDAPDPAPPSPATRRLFTACLDFVTTPGVWDLVDGEPDAVARLLATDQALSDQKEDRHRADALRALLSSSIDLYAEP